MANNGAFNHAGDARAGKRVVHFDKKAHRMKINKIAINFEFNNKGRRVLESEKRKQVRRKTTATISMGWNTYIYINIYIYTGFLTYYLRFFAISKHPMSANGQRTHARRASHSSTNAHLHGCDRPSIMKHWKYNLQPFLQHEKQSWMQKQPDDLPLHRLLLCSSPSARPPNPMSCLHTGRFALCCSLWTYTHAHTHTGTHAHPQGVMSDEQIRAQA